MVRSSFGSPWPHEIQVALPPSFGTDKRQFPMLWVTDGSTQFDIAVDVAERALRDIAELIVIGIGTPVGAEDEFTRRRVYDFTPVATRNADYVGRGADLLIREWVKAWGEDLDEWRQGGAGAFLEFIVSDLREEIEGLYGSSDQHAIYGYSRGGAFCMYALFTDPSAFSAFLAGSPTLAMNNDYVFELESQYAKTNLDLSARLFMSVGEGEMTEGWLPSAVGLVSSMSRMVEILRMREYPSLNMSSRILPGNVFHDPRGIALSLDAGLRAIFGSRR